MESLHLTLRQLQIFAAVARTGSTTAASLAISLSQSATSTALSELERLLSTALFDRVGKRLLLNDHGRALLPRALAALDAARAVEDSSRSSTAAQAQALRIGASTTIGNYLLPRLLSKFFAAQGLSASPSWRSSVSIANTASICASIARFELDVGLIEGPSHEPDLVLHLCRQDELVIVAASAHPLVSSSSGNVPVATIKSLRDAVWLLREPGSGTREATDQALLPKLGAYRRSIELGTSEAIKQAVAEGLGIACLSKWVVQDLIALRRLRVMKTTLPKMTRPCYWAMHRAKTMTPALQLFIDAICTGA